MKRIKKLKVNSFTFKVIWDKNYSGGSFDYGKLEIRIGCKDTTEDEQFMTLLHELQELAAVEMRVRLDRPDCTGDYIFCYDHRQHDLMSNMVAGWLLEVI